MKIIRLLCLLVVCIVTSISIQAQKLERTIGEVVSIYSLTVQAQTTYSLNFKRLVSSVSLVYEIDRDIKAAQMTVKGKRLPLSKNPHATDLLRQNTHLLVFDQATKQLQLETGELQGNIELHVYHLGNTQAIQRKVNAYKARFRTQQSCDKPVSVPQSIWRAGLSPAPIPDPVVTNVKHLIIHHSVSSNTATDMVAIMRGIYLYHRVTLGWNDIAYNYLIGPDGTIYEGRDPQGKEAEGDNIRGGHFCTGRQDGTMGVCLLGTFVDYEPPVPMLESLVNILKWKVKKDGMNPYGSFPHPLNNPIVAALPVISGHKDGCTTQCPGDKVYVKIADIRDKVNADVQVCAGKTDHCAPLRITGSIYKAVNQLVTDFETKLADCQSNGSNCQSLCSGKTYLDQIAQLRSQIQSIEQTCNNDAKNCIQPCNTSALTNQLTTLEQKVNDAIQFWLNETSTITQTLAQLESEAGNALTHCLTNADSCAAIYPTNTYTARIAILKTSLDSLGKVCAGDAQASTQKIEALTKRLTQLATKIEQRIQQLGQQALEINVYPNPVSGRGILQIKSPQLRKITQLRLRTVLGKSVVIQRTILGQQLNVLRVLLPQVPSGWYLLEIQIDGQWERRRLLVQ